MPILTSCCFCCSTRTGSKILGILSLIGSIVVFIGCIVALALWDEVKKALRDGAARGGQRIPEEYIDTLRILVIVAMIFLLFGIFIAGLMLYGVAKERPGFLVPWLVIDCVSIILIIISTIVNASNIMNWANIIGAIIEIALQIYFFLVVFSYYKELKENPGRSSSSANSPGKIY